MPRRLLYKLGLVKLVWVVYYGEEPYLRIVWYADGNRLVRFTMNPRNYFSKSFWIRLLPEGKALFLHGGVPDGLTWAEYTPFTQKPSPFSFLSRAKVIETRERLKQ